jgi:hypothetical protein
MAFVTGLAILRLYRVLIICDPAGSRKISDSDLQDRTWILQDRDNAEGLFHRILGTGSFSSGGSFNEQSIITNFEQGRT